MDQRRCPRTQALARQKTPVAKIAKSLKRTPGATQQKAFTLGVSSDRGSDALALLNEPHCCHSNRIHDGSAQFEPCRGGFLVNADLRSFTVTRRLPHRMAARLSRVQSPPSGKQGKGRCHALSPWPNFAHGICDALETDSLAGAAGFEPPHSGIEIRQELQPGAAGFEPLHLEIRSAELISPQRDVGVDRASERFVRSAARLRCANRVLAPGLRVSANLIPRCRGSNPAAQPASQSLTHTNRVALEMPPSGGARAERAMRGKSCCRRWR